MENCISLTNLQKKSHVIISRHSSKADYHNNVRYDMIFFISKWESFTFMNDKNQINVGMSAVNTYSIVAL